MDIINQLECDSSSNSGGIVMEDRVAGEDGDLTEIESDQAGSSSSQAISIEST